MKEVLCFIYDGFVDFETALTLSALNREDDYKVTYIAYEKTPICSWGGLKVNPDKIVSEIDGIEDIEGLIIPGGVNRILKPELEKLIKGLNKEKKLLAAICAGPEFLAKTGILNGKKYTTSEEPQSYEEKNEVDPFPWNSYVEARVVQDGNIITAKGHAFTDFALKIWDWYNLFESEKEKEDFKKDFTPV
ncbi:MAG: DJ-1/PfpI family protein [Candidatus Hermodarchaeota archaeon]